MTPETNTDLAAEVCKLRGEVSALRAELARLTGAVVMLIQDSEDFDGQIRRLASTTAGISVLKPPTLDDDAAINSWLNRAPQPVPPDVQRVIRYLLDYLPSNGK